MLFLSLLIFICFSFAAEAQKEVINTAVIEFQKKINAEFKASEKISVSGN